MRLVPLNAHSIRALVLLAACVFSATPASTRSPAKNPWEKEISVKKIDWLLLTLQNDLERDSYSEYFSLEALYYRDKKVIVGFRVHNYALFTLQDPEVKKILVEKILLCMAKLKFFVPELEGDMYDFSFFIRHTEKDFMQKYSIDLKARKIYASSNIIASYAEGKLKIFNDHFPWAVSSSDVKPTAEDWKSYQIKELLVSLLPKQYDYFGLQSVKYNQRENNYTLEVSFEQKSESYDGNVAFKRNNKPWQKDIMEKTAKEMCNLLLPILPDVEKNPKRVNFIFRISDQPEENYAEFKDGKARVY